MDEKRKNKRVQLPKYPCDKCIYKQEYTKLNDKIKKYESMFNRLNKLLNHLD